MSIRSELHGSLHREISGGWPAKEDAARGAATVKRARNNRWKREYRRETYEISSSALCPPAGEQETKSCHVGRRQRHRPGLAIPLVAGVVPGVRETKRAVGYPLFGFTYAPRRGVPRSMCARETDIPARWMWMCEYRRNCKRVNDWWCVCAVSTHTIQNAHTRTLSNFAKDRRPSSRFLGTESRARKRPSDWIDRNFKYILWRDGSSTENHRRRPPAGLRKISLISAPLDIIIIFRELEAAYGLERNTRIYKKGVYMERSVTDFEFNCFLKKQIRKREESAK